MFITCDCGKRLRVPDDAAVQTVRCPSCGKRRRVAGSPGSLAARTADAVETEEPEDFSHVRRSAGLPFRVWPYVRFYPLRPLLLTGLLLGFAALAVLVHWTFWIAFAFVALVSLYYWLVVWSYFHHGGVYPAVVVSEQPYRVAALVNLSLGLDGFYPAVQVVDLALGRMPGRLPLVGDRLITVHLVAGEDEARQRATRLYCVPARFLTGNEAVLRRFADNIGDDEWDILEQFVSRCGDSCEVGIHRLDAGAEEDGPEGD
jgi:hypothetical protein